jgi:D-alanyl-lipoteichoic acid acyltransferase DltB (MBOAT superfamily)
MCWNPTYALLMAFSSLVTFLSGRFIDNARNKHPDDPNAGKVWLVLSIVINLSILFFYKYFNFIVTDLFAGVSALFPEWGLSTVSLSVVLPVGISFYTFQALGYTIDVYRKDVEVERNLIRYFVFVSFFPQLVAGPIERSGNLLHQFREKHTFHWEPAKDGLLLMLWGYFQKLVIADRVSILVDQVFDHYTHYQGVEMLVAAVFFGVQIYCDFAAYSNIAIGAAKVMGFTLMQNFDTPYFSRSVAEFWRRWHISLSGWFRDYLYFPLGGSRCSKSKWRRNIMIVFLVSGMWHGAGWNYLLWGGLNGLYQVIGDATKAKRKKLCAAMQVDTEAFSHKLLQMIITFVLVDFAWIFFRASDIRTACAFIWRMIGCWKLSPLFDGSLFKLGLDSGEFLIAMISIGVLLAVSCLHYKGVHIRDTLRRQGLWFRWSVYLLGMFFVLIFGVYGPGFNAEQFIYFQF